MNEIQISFAPLQGYVDNVYRRLHADIYGGIDCYYTPFIRMEKGEPRRQDMARLAASVDDGLNVVPQIIFGSIEEFDVLTGAMKDKGCREIDLNLGCPYSMQTRKGRGAAMIADQATMEKVAERIASDGKTSYSVKMRVGAERPDEWRVILPLLNQLKLSHITVHPRTAGQMYGGTLYRDEFDQIFEESKNPVVWNGDILNAADISATVERYSGLKGIMIGRGLLGRPSLAAEWRTGKDMDKDERMAKLLEFHDRLLSSYEESLCGQTQILQKIKPFWDYMEPEVGRKTCKQLRKATTLPKYRAALPR